MPLGLTTLSGYGPAAWGMRHQLLALKIPLQANGKGATLASQKPSDAWKAMNATPFPNLLLVTQAS